MEATTNHLLTNASAVILGGGKSSRMGSPKALLSFDGEPLVVHITRRLNSLFSDIVVAAAPGELFLEFDRLLGSRSTQPNVTLIHDEIAYQGPVGGIYYG